MRERGGFEPPGTSFGWTNGLSKLRCPRPCCSESNHFVGWGARSREKTDLVRKQLFSNWSPKAHDKHDLLGYG